MEETYMEQAVQKRYSEGAEAREQALCCPVSYDPKFLEVIPEEILEKDYGCGDPSSYLNEGQTVLDLGSGGGKICYIAAQKVGASGKVIGVDMNDDMLSLARKYQGEIGDKLGFSNVQFLKGKIQDLALDLTAVENRLRKLPVQSARDLTELDAEIAQQKKNSPLIKDESIDIIVSNCVLNLVNEQDKAQLFQEMYRVLKVGGEIAISDIVVDEPVPESMKSDPELWSGCLSGAMTETGFLKAFEDAGFVGMEIASRDLTPWQTIDGFEFRSVLVRAKKPSLDFCWDHHQAVIYKGPFSRISDDDGHTFMRGERMSVCKKTFDILKSSRYAEHFCFVEPLNEVSKEDAKPFTKETPRIRSPRVTKGAEYSATVDNTECGSTKCC